MPQSVIDFCCLSIYQCVCVCLRSYFVQKQFLITHLYLDKGFFNFKMFKILKILLDKLTSGDHYSNN